MKRCDAMKKLISLFLALVLFSQILPLNAIAEALYPIPTNQELSAALAKTGLSEGAPGYRQGMAPSQSMNAMQLAGWIKDFQENKLSYIMDIFENYDVELSYVKEKYPVTFDLLKGFNEAGIGKLYAEYSDAKAWKDDVNYYYNSLVTTAGDIYVKAELLQREETAEKEQIVYAYEIRDAWRRLEDMIPEVVDRAGLWNDEFDRLKNLLTGVYAYSGADDSLGWLLEEVDHLRARNQNTERTVYSVSAGAVRVQPDQTVMTRIARLSPISNALADSDQTMTVMVIDDKDFAVGVKDESGPVADAAISVSAAGQQGTVYTEATDNSGYVSFPVRNFQCDEDGEMFLYVRAEKNGYRAMEANGIWIKKGSGLTLPLEKDDGTPYLVSWSFWNHDVQCADYIVVTSPYNDTKQDITVKVKSAADYHITVYFADESGMESLRVGEGDGKAGEQAFTFSGQWLAKAPAKGALHAVITSNGKEYPYKSKLVLNAPVLQDPIGDPNLKSLMTPGLQFTLPSSWPNPLGGLKIAIDFPLAEEYQIRAYYDMNGNGMITFGTTAFDSLHKKASDDSWKSQDKRAMDKDIKKAEDQGSNIKSKGKNGGSWPGKKAFTPFAMGKISFKMSWFGFAQVQFQKTKDYFGQVFGKGGAGFTATVSGEYTFGYPVANLSISLSMALTMFPEIGVMINTYWPPTAELPEIRKFDYVKGALNFLVRLELCISATVGVKKVASVSVRGIGYLEFALRFTSGIKIEDFIRDWAAGKNIDSSKYNDKDVTFTIYAGGQVDLIAKIFWVKVTYSVMKPIKWQLHPEIKRISDAAPVTLTDRFIAFLLSPAHADESEGPEEGGGQVHTDNEDLILAGRQVDTMNGGFDKTEVLTMRASGSDEQMPVMLFIQAMKHYEYIASKPILWGQVLDQPFGSRAAYTPMPCENDRQLPENLQDHYGTKDGYDVVDFTYWLADVSDLGITSMSSPHGGKQEPVKDILFTLCILAKGYTEYSWRKPDGTIEKQTLPKETWAYVQCYYLNSDKHLTPLVLPQEYETLSNKASNYLSMCYPLDTKGSANVTGDARLFGSLIKKNGSVYYTYYITASPILPVYVGNQTGRYVYTVFDSNKTASERGDLTEPYLRTGVLSEFDDAFFEKAYTKLYFFDPNLRLYAPTTAIENLFTRHAWFTLTHDTLAQEGLSEIVFRREDYHTGIPFAENVASMAVRAGNFKDEYDNQQAFFVQQTEDQEGYRLMSCRSNTARIFHWVVKDYDITLPACEIQWTTLYGRECIYWMESAGETEDGSANLFKVRGVWYDESADAVSEPFTIATIKTDTADDYPDRMMLAGNDQGFYFVYNESGQLKLYRFNFQLVMGMKLVGNVLTDTLANPGSYDDMLLTMNNNGNIPISGMDLVAYHQLPSGTAEPFEYIHLDFMYPSRNTVTLRSDMDGGQEQRSGEKVARAEDCAFNADGQQYRYMKETAYMVENGVRHVLDETASLMKPNLLMPGTFGAYNISLLLPQGWKGSQTVYLEVDRLYTTNSAAFQSGLNGGSGALLLKAAPAEEIVSIGKDGTVRKERSGGVLRAASLTAAEPDGADDFSMFKTDISFDRIELDTKQSDLEISASRWELDNAPMVTLTVTNRAHISESGRVKNTVLIEAFLDEETTPVFRYSLPDEVSDKETWNFDLPLSLLTGGRSASKVTVKVGGKDYQETGIFDNSAEILLNTDTLSFLVQPSDQEAPAGAGVQFHAAAIGGRMPYRYQWQMKTPKGNWESIASAASDTLILKAVTMEMSGNLYRLVVTDASGSIVQSSAASLTVKKVPHTGDDAPLAWWMLGSVIALAGIVYVLIARKKEQHEKTV